MTDQTTSWGRAGLEFLDRVGGGLSLGTKGALATFNFIHPDAEMSSNNGPKFKADTVQTSTYGEAIPRIYGRVTTSGNIFWLEKNKLKVVTKNVQPESGAGGK